MGHNYDEMNKVFMIRLKESVTNKYGSGLAAGSVIQGFPEKGGFASVTVYAELLLKPHEFEEVVITDDGQVRPVRRTPPKKRKRKR